MHFCFSAYLSSIPPLIGIFLKLFYILAFPKATHLLSPPQIYNMRNRLHVFNSSDKGIPIHFIDISLLFVFFENEQYFHESGNPSLRQLIMQDSIQYSKLTLPGHKNEYIFYHG